MFMETMGQCAIFLGIVFAPVWAYILFCLGRGVIDDARKFIRKRAVRRNG